MSTVLDHPLVTGYLHELDIALGGLPPGAASELSEQLRAHLLEALPDGADDATIRGVLAALGPARLVAQAAAESGRQHPLLRRLAAAARRVPMRIWIAAALLAIAVGAPAGTLIYWQAQPAIAFDAGSSWWGPQDAPSVQTEADGAAQSTVPLRPGQMQGFEIFVYNPSDTSQRILGAQAGYVSPGAPVPPQIDVSTTGSWQLVGEPNSVKYQVGGTIPPHSYRWLRVQWRSYQCYLQGPGGSQGIDRLTLRVKVGWITRTEVIPLPFEFAVSPTTKWPAWCNGHPAQP